MRFFKIILVYLLLGSIMGVVYSVSGRDQHYLVLCYHVFAGRRISHISFFRGRRNLIFRSIAGLLLIQMVSVETASFSYLFSIGFFFFNNFRFDGFSASSIHWGISASDFSPVLEGERETIGFNIVAFVLLLLLIVNWKK